MSYDTGKFYTDSDGNQHIDDVIITSSTIGGIKFLSGAAVPDSEVLAPAGALYICTLAESVGLYQNVGTSTVPEWKLFGSE